MTGRQGIAAAVAVSAIAGGLELFRLRSHDAWSEPLRRVGLRALGTSIAHSAVSIAVLW
jgi:hypothetical protein